MLRSIAVFIEGLLFIYLSFLAGTLLLKTLGFRAKSLAGEIAYPIISGYCLYGLVSLILGLLGFFKTGPLLAINIVLIATSLSTIRGHLADLCRPNILLRKVREFAKGKAKITFALYLLIIIWISANLLLVFVPITAHDTLHYHWPIISTIVEEGEISFQGEIEHYGYLPIFGEILYAAPIVIFKEMEAPFVFQLIQYSFLPLILLIIADFLNDKIKVLFLKPAALLSILSVMDVEREILHFGYVDMLTALLGIAALLLVLDSLKGGVPKSNLYLAATFLGFALSVKYSALYFLAFTSIFAIIQFIREKIHIREVIRRVALFALIIIAISGFWYIKNIHFFGNPVYPMFSHPEFSRGVGQYIMDRTIPNMLIFPFYRFGVQWFLSPDRESTSQFVVTALFIAFYFLITILLLRRAKFGFVEAALFLFTQGYLSTIFFSSHQVRFLLPAIIMAVPLIAILGDLLLETLKVYGGIFQTRTIGVSGAILLLCFLLLFGGNIHYFKVRFLFTTGQIGSEEYILRIGSQ